MDSLDPKQAIIPLVRLDAKGLVEALLGTGFFVGSRPAVVTAGHVFADNPLEPGQSYAMCYVLPGDEVRTAIINDHLISPAYDIAVFAAGGVPNATSLRISKALVAPNVDVLTYEFSGTSIENRDGKRQVHFSPFTHKGNVLRHYVSDFPEPTPTAVFDTSFPALQGASGAPVVRATDFAVVGMLVANRERHLMPAQIVRIHDGDKTLEETKYFLPTGKALEGRLIAEYLEEIKADAVMVA